MQNKPITIGEVEARNVERLAGQTIPANPKIRTRFEEALAKTWGAGEHPAWSDELGQCRVCRTAIDNSPVTHGDGPFQVTMRGSICEACEPIVRAHYYGERSEIDVTQTPNFDSQCPQKTREIIEDGAIPRAVDRDAFNRVTAWRPSDGKGMAILGPQGSGKTLALWSLFRNLEREQYSPKILTAVQLSRVLGEAARDIREVSWLYNCRVLMIDDLGKERLSPSVAALLWEVLDRRYGSGRPIVLTTRFSGAEMIQRFGELHLGEDIRRRLNELCVGVRFEMQNKSAA